MDQMTFLPNIYTTLEREMSFICESDSIYLAKVRKEENRGKCLEG